MTEILPHYGVEIKLIERIRVDGEIISASKVRDLIRISDWESIKKAVPESTYNYLLSPEAAVIIETIRKSHSRH